MMACGRTASPTVVGGTSSLMVVYMWVFSKMGNLMAKVKHNTREGPCTEATGASANPMEKGR